MCVVCLIRYLRQSWTITQCKKKDIWKQWLPLRLKGMLLFVSGMSTMCYQGRKPVGDRRSQPHPWHGCYGDQNLLLWSSQRTQCWCQISDKLSHGWRPICRTEDTTQKIWQQSVVSGHSCVKDWTCSHMLILLFWLNMRLILCSPVGGRTEDYQTKKNTSTELKSYRSLLHSMASLAIFFIWLTNTMVPSLYHSCVSVTFKSHSFEPSEWAKDDISLLFKIFSVAYESKI